MWTNRGTWQKASRWSSIASVERFGRTAAGFFGALCLGILALSTLSCEGAGFLPSSRFGSPAAQGEEGPERAEVGGTGPSPRSVGAPAGFALLERGGRPVSGLPGFGANAFRALYGEYSLYGRADSDGPQPELIRVWVSGEPLYFSAGLWAEERAGGLVLYASREGGLWAADGASAGGLASWTVIFGFGGTLPETNRRDFIAKFIARFSYYLGSARTSTDVSLPAILE